MNSLRSRSGEPMPHSEKQRASPVLYILPTIRRRLFEQNDHLSLDPRGESVWTDLPGDDIAQPAPWRNPTDGGIRPVEIAVVVEDRDFGGCRKHVHSCLEPFYETPFGSCRVLNGQHL